MRQPRSLAVVRLAGLFVCVCVAGAQPERAGQNSTNSYPPQMDGAKTEVYKKIGDVELKLYIFQPPGHSATDKTPAIVFFFGGGWRSGTPRQFEQHCLYLASRGMVAITADYRVSGRHNTKVSDSLRDAKSALRWVRHNAARLGIDATRIAAGGGSAGGHLAAATAVVPGFDEPGEDTAISSRPDALILFNPVLVLAWTPGSKMANGRRPNLEVLDKIPGLAGVDRVSLSPFHHVQKGAPPAVVFHGRADASVPYDTAELFTSKMKAAGNRCELVGFDGESHGFFNYGRNGNKAYYATVQRADEFLTSLGYLTAKPAVP